MTEQEKIDFKIEIYNELIIALNEASELLEYDIVDDICTSTVTIENNRWFKKLAVKLGELI